MTFARSFLHRRSLLLGVLLFPLSVVLGVGWMPIPLPGLHAEPFPIALGALSSASGVVLCTLAWINLVRDVERGYPPPRCSVAALVLLTCSISPALGSIAVMRQILK